MKRYLVSMFLVVVVALSFRHAAFPALASAELEPDCTQVEFYLVNTLDVVVEYDVANWSTADRALGYLTPGEEHRFNLPPGVFEFWITDYDHWDLGEWIYLPACSRAAAYVKLVKGQAILKVKVFLPETD